MDMLAQWREQLDSIHAQIGRIAMQQRTLQAQRSELERRAASLDGAIQAAELMAKPGTGIVGVEQA